MQNRGFQQCVNTELASVLVRDFQKVGDAIEVWFVNEHRVTIHRKIILSNFLGCVVANVVKLVKLLVFVMRMPCALRQRTKVQKKGSNCSNDRRSDTVLSSRLDSTTVWSAEAFNTTCVVFVRGMT